MDTYPSYNTTEKNTHHTDGVSKNMVYLALKSLGVETFDQFENANLIEYILGEGSQEVLFMIHLYLNH